MAKKLQKLNFKLLLIFLVIIVINFTIFGNYSCNCPEIKANVPDDVKITVEPKEDVQAKVNTPKEIKTVYMGDFVATAYCICYKCCGKTPQHPAYGITASGKRATPGRTVAVDPNVIPLGSTVIVNGTEYIAEDTGKAIKGNRVDICFASHEEALQFGRQIVEVEVIF